ncbi:histidine kinase [Croceicoccus estronivorus]|uniref:sensor histidine kinase n=1 Tax=Croceicoccus estronivorus TaxID=1172626 RepID=UPI00082AF60F|nr:HAMP domain-containing sensor histidine kinase [Croceicoccus estronivorus]OCC23195.1 histidine kinase [Croceicoccus estronivorus]
MATAGTFLAHATCDAEDRLIDAGEPLAGLQLRCGGELPGTIAIPGLLELVRKCRRFGLKLAQPVQAQDGEEQVTAWVEVFPSPKEKGGCEILIASWKTLPLKAESLVENTERRMIIDRQLAEFTARLDPQQNLLTFECTAKDLIPLAGRMGEGTGKPWTDFVAIAGSSHHQPLHWRLLDGASIIIEGSERQWRVSMVPLGAPEPGSAGFELYFVADQPLPRPCAVGKKDADKSTTFASRDIAPVLRQPIARIVANAETIRSRLAGPLAEEYGRYAADIAAAGKHLLALVDDLTDLEVVEAEDFSTAPDRIDLGDIARRAAGILGVRAQEKEITIHAPGEGESLPAVGEFRRVLQVLLNLVGNAVRYAPKGSEIWLRLEHHRGRVGLSVIDQGPGLSDEQQAKVFEKFERLGRSGDGGSGLGLYISRRLARAMDGDLTVQSVPGQGARFTLELPADLPEN